MTRDEKEKLATEIVSLYLDSGFGSASKREIDLLIFHHVTQAREHRGKSNYELSALLKIPESRVKTFRLTSALKHQDINTKAILGNIIIRLSRGQQFTSVDNGKIELSLEDPVEKRELENLLKSKGHFAEYTFNAEVLRIAPVRLFELIVENMERAEDQFNALVRQHIDDQAASERILKGASTLKQKFARFREEKITTSNILSLIGAAASVFAA